MSEKNNKREWLFLILRIALGCLFIWAGWNKLGDPGEFARIIHNYKILPSFMINPVAIVLPWVELVCGLLLVSGFMVSGSSLIINILLVIFFMALGLNLYRGLNVACGCFTLSQEAEKISLYTLIREMPFLISGIWLLFYQMKKNRNLL